MRLCPIELILPELAALTDATQVKSVVERFRSKYGTSGVNLYSKLDVAVIAQTR